MNSFRKFIGHLRTVLIHRYWVFVFCMKAGIPIAGITHDLSKFSYKEFWEGVKYYQGNRSPIDACKEENEYSAAWLHHKGRNPHHYEYWQDNFDNGGEPLKMPYRYAMELICDYLAAGKVYMKDKFTYQAEYDWWKVKRCKNISMHKHTELFIEEMLSKMAIRDNCVFLRKDLSKIIYDEVDIRLNDI